MRLLILPSRISSPEVCYVNRNVPKIQNHITTYCETEWSRPHANAKNGRRMAPIRSRRRRTNVRRLTIEAPQHQRLKDPGRGLPVIIPRFGIICIVDGHWCQKDLDVGYFGTISHFASMVSKTAAQPRYARVAWGMDSTVEPPGRVTRVGLARPIARR
jgi:hypothetical protein